MPDPLDPTDAFTSAFRGAFVSFGGVAAVSLGGHVCGSLLHDVAQSVAAIPSGGWSAVSAPGFDPLTLAFTWLAVFPASAMTWRGWPFLIFDLWLIARLRSGAELFPVLLAIAIAQPLHSLLIADRFSPLSATELAIGIALWLVVAILTGALALWWRQTSENAPEHEPEPEL